MDSNGKVAVIMPAYNEADAIGQVLEDLVPIARTLSSGGDLEFFAPAFEAGQG